MANVGVWHTKFYEGRVTGPGETAILRFSDLMSAAFERAVHFGIGFAVEAGGMDVGEANDIQLKFYPDESGTVLMGTLSFERVTKDNPTDLKMWPAGIEGFHKDTPIPPFFSLAWSPTGPNPDMTFACYGSFWREE